MIEPSVPTVPALIARATSLFPDNDSFVFPESRQTYAELEQSAVDVARSMTAMGIGPGDAVGVVMPNCPEFLHVMFGTAMIGALFVPINSRLAPRELAYVIPDADIRLIVTTDVVDQHVDYVARLHSAFPALADAAIGHTPEVIDAPRLAHAVVLGKRSAPGFLNHEDFLALGDEVEASTVRAVASGIRPESPYIMMYTSGTTSAPKGCPLSHAAVVKLGTAVGEEAFRITEADRMWNPLPMFHVSAQAPMIGILNAGATYVSMTHFDATEALELIDREKATILYPAYPTITAPLLNHVDYTPDTFKGVRGLLTVGPPELLAGYQSRLPHTTHVSCYGSTETGGIAVMGKLTDPLADRLTCGKPFDGIEAQIRDVATGNEVPTGETGALYMRGYNLFMGYHKDPQKTADSFDSAGWFFTGDLASIDERGNLSFRGRTKDMLKVGGENVGCLEVEAYLMTHPDVVLAAVVGLPDEKYGEVPAAFVELREGSDIDAADLLAFAREGLAKYKVPKLFRFVSSWPMSATKIQKHRLLDQLDAPSQSASI
ncbi:class I adenylate-forming enzyme family protein [Gordonia rubripertincta]|uniref:AMP-binding protein n=1 Tax=Gordonia rubripertincta TaxID=36822 RepID=A0ABT4MWN3_GORRU|nr:AMP-binding protein [Gordonia rubripertincta]MCZ4551428.1 AMP-binding protein [Gordonia rubripertincta]